MKILKLCSGFFRKYKIGLFLYASINIVSGIIGIFIPYFSGLFVDALTINQETDTIFQFAAYLSLLSVVMILLGYITNRLSIRLKTHACYSFIKHVLDHLRNVDIRYFVDKKSSLLTQQLYSDINALVGFYMNIISGVILKSITLIILSIVVLSIDIRLGIIFFAILIIYTLIYFIFKPILFKETMVFTDTRNQFYSKINDQISKFNFIRTHSLANFYDKKLEESYGSLYKRARKYNDVSYVFSSMDTIITTIAQVSIFIFGGIAVVNGYITIGFFTMLITYFSMLLNSLKYFFGLTRYMQETLVSFTRVSDILKVEIITNGNKVIEKIEEIKIKNLCFSYTEDKTKIINNASHTLIRGKIYCLSGINGAGKTTFIHLLAGLLQSDQGEICYNNSPIRDVDMITLRKHNIGFTDQDSILINGTLIENLFLDSNNNISDSNLDELLAIISFKKFIETLPEGLNTIIGENYSNISGGERQKISIIRQLLKNPQLMIFDEPTSSLDHVSKIDLINHLNRIKRDKIIILVTHDEEIIKGCDIEIELKGEVS